MLLRTNWFKNLTHDILVPPVFAFVALLAPIAFSAYQSGLPPSELTPTGEASGQITTGALTFIQLVLFNIGLTLAVLSIAMLLYRWRPTRLFLHVALFTVLVELFYRVIYHGPVTASVMFAIVGTSPREAGELLAAHPVLTGLLFLAALAATYASVKSWGIQNPFPTVWCVRTSVSSICLLLVSLALTWWQVNSEWTLKQVW